MPTYRKGRVIVPKARRNRIPINKGFERFDCFHKRFKPCDLPVCEEIPEVLHAVVSNAKP